LFWCAFPQDALLAYMNAQAVKNDIRMLIENRSKFVLVRSSSGHRHALKEVMQDPIVQAQLADAKVCLGAAYEQGLRRRHCTACTAARNGGVLLCVM
jgi:stalled ribosome rescue protein Dom34